MNKAKIVSVIACISVIVICIIYYTGYVSQAIYEVRTDCPEVESCSAGKVDTAPEGYTVSYYGNDDDLKETEVVEVTWLLSNITNEQIDVDDFWTNYESMDGGRLYVMEKKEALAVSDYENRRVIPPGEQTAYAEYVLVPAGCHEIRAKFRNAAQKDGREILAVTF